ncbi:hypothetical protein CPLU01_08451 [Colletotrichum plurivorum]|uniref:Uncharacterized protein n=1 Tax=Colletotrichum plurivorum TaxID=2175906 RepID=A0A8H6KBF1_9PEZI|nr:hypothetical protein CPLU01_08451 [Colletotrichum plurivorum]
MSLSKPLVGLEDFHWPYEIFLCIMEQFIEKAKADQSPLLLSVHYNRNSNARLALCCATEEIEKTYQLAKDRLDAIRIPLQVNRKTRALVDCVFRLVPMGGFSEASHGLLRVLSDLDYFTPFDFTPGIVLPVFNMYLLERFFHDNVYLPNAEGHGVLQNIKHLLLPQGAFITTQHQECAITDYMSLLLGLPNIQSISVPLGRVNMDLVTSMSTIHAGLQRIDEDIFPDLAAWLSWVPNMTTLFRPLQRKGVKFRGFLEILDVDVLEFSPDGIKRNKSVYPTLICEYLSGRLEALPSSHHWVPSRGLIQVPRHGQEGLLSAVAEPPRRELEAGSAAVGSFWSWEASKRASPDSLEACSVGITDRVCLWLRTTPVVALAMALNTGRPVRLPYEVFLNIIDAFINEAESEALFIGLNFFVEDEEFVVDYNLPIDSSYHRERFEQLCPVLQVNQDTRRMVLRTFQPIKLRQPGSYNFRQQDSASGSTLRTPRRPEVFWALFSLDHFTAGSIEALLDLDTVMETSSVKCIEILDDMTSEIFDEETEEAADNIFSLPNLREVNFSLGFHDSECSMAESD